MNNLRYLRNLRGLTQEQMAESLGTTRNHYLKLENGTRRLNLSWIESAAAFLKVDPGEIVGNPRASAPPLLGFVTAGGFVRWSPDVALDRVGMGSLMIRDGAIGAHFQGWHLIVDLAPLKVGPQADRSLHVLALAEGTFVVRTLLRDSMDKARLHSIDLAGHIEFDTVALYALEVSCLVNMRDFCKTGVTFVKPC